MAAAWINGQRGDRFRDPLGAVRIGRAQQPISGHRLGKPDNRSGCGGRVGFHHKTLASFLSAIVSSGLHIRDVREFASSGVVLPRNIGLVAERAEK